MRRFITKVSSLSFLVLVLAAFTCSTITSFMPQKASAVSGGDFNPGRIIDDVIFTNSSSMSVNDIQNFLNSKVPNCDVHGTKNSTHWNSGANRYYTRAEWGALKGQPAPYTCLRDYRENTTTFANNAADPNISVPGGKSAAQIIWDAAQAHRINPQVLLATLQKEQSLITDDWPWTNQYDYALGWGCPDTAACNQNYKGFYKQVDKSAWQFRYYLENPGDYNYWVGNYYVQYNPNANCGGRVINIQNAATAALYIYTPYQPNTAALNNVYGQGDSCSAYGNRNFWVFFTDWFGSTYAASYHWQPITQAIYTDSSKTKKLGWGATLISGDTAFASLTVKNTGNQTWTKTTNPVRLAPWNPQDRYDAFCTPAWISCNRVTTFKESSVPPGGTATFEFPIKAPNQGRLYRENFNLVAEGKAWFNDAGQYFDIDVKAQRHTWSLSSQAVYADSTKATKLGWNANNVLPGQKVYVVVKAKNTGNVGWFKNGTNPVHIGTWNPQDVNSGFCSGWIRCNRAAVQTESSVPPGGTATFEFWAQTSSSIREHRQHFNLVAEGKTWMNNIGMFVSVTTSAPKYTWQPTGQAVYSDINLTNKLGWNATLSKGQTAYAVISAKNTGNVAWKKGTTTDPTINVGTWNPQDRISKFCNGWGASCNRGASMTETVVEPGQIATFKIPIKAPAISGTYNEYFNLVAEGKTWMNSTGQFFTFTVQ